MLEARTVFHRLSIVALIFAVGCFAHAPEQFAGADSVVVQTELPEWPVNITEDAWGIPHIRARSLDDSVFALGFLQAEERLWQLEFIRRVGSGTLSEILGRRTLGTDRFLRTVGFRRAAWAAWNNLPERERELLQAYADGINAGVAQLDELPPEFGLLRFDFEPWTPIDSLVVTKSMAWLLSGSAGEDSLYWRVARELGEEQTSWFLPDYPDDAPRILPPDQMRELRGHRDPTPEPAAPAPVEEPPPEEGQRRGPSSPDAVAQLGELLGMGDDVGSNAWVVHGSRTDTGLPILSNDPHLGVQVPGIWYLAEIETPQIHVIGPTLVGLPGMPIGHNEHIAWGLTNSGVDVMDLVRERPDPEDPTRLQRQDGWEQTRAVTEVIEVKGRPKPVYLEVRVSTNGPLVTEFFGEDFEPGEEVAMRWTALNEVDGTVSAFFGVMAAKNWEGFKDALEPFVAPSQNFVYADRTGTIGLKVPGLVPVRDDGFDGQRPARGWVAADDWQGWVPYDELPEAVDPLQGWIVTANNHVVPDDYPYNLGVRFTSPHRAIRIIDLVEQGEGRDVQGNRRIQMDVVATRQVAELMPTLLAIQPDGELEGAAHELLRNWDGSHDVNSGGAAVFNAWIIEVVEAVLAGPLDGKLRSRVYGTNPLFIAQLFGGGPASALCVTEGGKGRTSTADCDALAAESFGRAVGRLRKELGADVTQWRWGDLHHIRYHHPLAFLPSLRKTLDTELESPGGSSTPNVGSYPLSSPFVQTWHPSYRQVVDLSDWNNSVWIASLGQSGVPWRAHYRDMAAPYVAGDALPMLFGREAVQEHAARTRQIRR